MKINAFDTNFMVSIRSCQRFLRYGARFVCFVKYHFFKIFENSSQRGKFLLKTILTSENQCLRHEFHGFNSILQVVFEIWSSFRLFHQISLFQNFSKFISEGQVSFKNHSHKWKSMRPTWISWFRFDLASGFWDMELVSFVSLNITFSKFFKIHLRGASFL